MIDELCNKQQKEIYVDNVPYKFKLPPFDHQWDVLVKSWDKTQYAFFTEMGTGKSKMLIDTIGMLYTAGKIQAALIIAPKGVYMNWYNKEFPQHLPDNIQEKTVMAYWSSSTSQQVKKQLDRVLQIEDNSKRLFILVMNIDAINTDRGLMTALNFIDAHKPARVLAAIDESTIIKNPKAERTKRAVKIGNSVAYRRILTGSPVTKTPMDLYCQAAFLGKELLGHSSWYSFRNEYAVLIDQTTYGGQTFKVIAGFKNLEQLTEKLNKFSVRLTKEQCLDLPEKIYARRDVLLTPEQTKAYKEMKQLAATEILGKDVSVTIVLTKLLKLHQIVCGCITADDGTQVEIKNNRLEELMQILSETSEKVIIWANYRHNIQAIEKEIKNVYGQESYVMYYGDTKPKEREEAIQRFQEDPECRFFVGNTQTGGYGITLTAATIVVYFSNSYDLEKRLQSEDRAHRIGQHSSVTYIDLVSPGTVDEKIIQALRNKINVATQVLGDEFKEWLI